MLCIQLRLIPDPLYIYVFVFLQIHRILGLSAVMGDVEWKTEQVQFLLHKAFFYPHSKEKDVSPVSALLAGMQHAACSN
jgi:hypothetical protein